MGWGLPLFEISQGIPILRYQKTSKMAVSFSFSAYFPNTEILETRINPRFFALVLGQGFIFVQPSHVGAKSALLRRLFLPTAQKAAGRVAPLLLLPAKSHAAPPLFACKRAHNALACYQLFVEKGKGAFSQRLAVSVQNPGGRSPEGFSCPIRPRTKMPGCCRIRAFLYQQSGPGDRSPCFSARTSSRVQGWVL